MPIYGYRCGRGHQFDVPQRITDAPLTTCPECGSPVTRVFYPVGIIFKGQGFYKTDSRGSSTAVSPAKDDGSKAAPAAPASSSEGGGKESSEKPAAPIEEKKSDS
jgi:putative FmdB family regulatory protein